MVAFLHREFAFFGASFDGGELDRALEACYRGDGDDLAEAIKGTKSTLTIQWVDGREGR